MALIHCPECGHEISDTAKTCPNCGVRITVCPECGKVFAGEREVCDNCGFKIINEVKPLELPQKNLTIEAASLESRWQSQTTAGRAISHILNIIYWICAIAAIVFSIAIIVMYIVWDMKPSLEKFDTIVSHYDTIKTLVVFGCITFGIDGICSFSKDKINFLIFTHWFNTQKIDGKKFIEEHYTDFTSPADATSAEAVANTLQGAYLNEHPGEKTVLAISCIVNLILCIVAYVCLGVAICENLNVLMLARVFEVQLNISDLKFVAAIICAIAFISKKIFVWKFDGLYNARCNNWLKSLPDKTSAD